MQRLASWASHKFILGTNSVMKDRKTGIQVWPLPTADAVAGAVADDGADTKLRQGLRLLSEADSQMAAVQDEPTNPETRLQRAIGLLQAMDITLLEEGIWAIEVIKQAAPETLASLLH